MENSSSAPGPRARKKPLPLEPALLTLEQAAQILNVSTKTVKRMLACGEMPGTRRVHRRVLILRSELERWLERGCPQPPHAPGRRNA
jgi:excisionase family DNA binding protein